MSRFDEAVAHAVILAARVAVRALPKRVVKRVEDGLFHYIYQKTRVENDAYGWRPPPPGQGSSTTSNLPKS